MHLSTVAPHHPGNGVVDEEMKEGVVGRRRGATQAGLPWAVGLLLRQGPGLEEEIAGVRQCEPMPVSGFNAVDSADIHT